MTQWRHKKRGSTYDEVCRAVLQASDPSLLAEGAEVVVYRGADGRTWCRAAAEFGDGRFERLGAPEGLRLKKYSQWLISVPAWGQDYLRTFAECAAPALLAAVRALGEPVKFLIHTDRPDLALAALPGQDVEVRPVGSHPTYVALQRAHAEAVAVAAPGDRVVLLNADLVVSGNLLVRCAEHFASGKQAVVLLGIRTAAGPARPPAGGAPRALLEWAWAHRHQIIRDLEWPHGQSMLPTNLFFACGGSVVARGFHLHPAAIIKHADVDFSSTIDGDLLDCFPRESVHVVTDPDDCAMLEVSPPERRFPVREGSLSPGNVAAAMATRASATHRWLFEQHRIGVVGPLCDCGDEAVVRETLEIMARGAPAQVGGRRGRDPAGRRGRIPGSPADIVP